MPLGEFLTFFLVGLTVAWEHLIASAGDDPRLRDQLLERVSAVIANQTQLMTVLTEAYVEERERRSRFREQDLDDFVQLLLAPEAVPNVLERAPRRSGSRRTSRAWSRSSARRARPAWASRPRRSGAG